MDTHICKKLCKFCNLIQRKFGEVQGGLGKFFKAMKPGAQSSDIVDSLAATHMSAITTEKAKNYLARLETENDPLRYQPLPPDPLKSRQIQPNTTSSSFSTDLLRPNYWKNTNVDPLGAKMNIDDRPTLNDPLSIQKKIFDPLKLPQHHLDANKKMFAAEVPKKMLKEQAQRPNDNEITMNESKLDAKAYIAQVSKFLI